MKVEIVNLIEMLEEIVNNGGKVPFSNKITVDKDEVLSVLNEMRMRLPSDIKLAIDILDEKQRKLDEAEENGVIRLTASEGRRKSYIITEVGREMLRQEYGRLLVMVRDGSRFWEK